MSTRKVRPRPSPPAHPGQHPWGVSPRAYGHVCYPQPVYPDPKPRNTAGGRGNGQERLTRASSQETA